MYAAIDKLDAYTRSHVFLIKGVQIHRDRHRDLSKCISIKLVLKMNDAKMTMTRAVTQ